MIKKINYNSEWVCIQKAIPLFNSINDFIAAASENKIFTRGRISTSGEPDSEYSDIKSTIWENCFFDKENYILEDVGNQADEGYLLSYVEIQIKRNDLILFVLSQRHSGSSNELQEAIKLAYIKLYLPKTDGSYPRATEVLQEIETNLKNTPFIKKIDRSVGKEASIWWTTADGNNTEMTHGRLKNLMTDIKSTIKEIENHV